LPSFVRELRMFGIWCKGESLRYYRAQTANAKATAGVHIRSQTGAVRLGSGGLPGSLTVTALLNLPTGR
jgi:hypothetical protein